MARVIFFRFIDKIQGDIDGMGVKEQLQALCGIYALSLLHKHLGEFLSTGCLTPKQAALANEKLRSLYAKVFMETFPVSNSKHIIFQMPK